MTLDNISFLLLVSAFLPALSHSLFTSFALGLPDLKYDPETAFG